MQMLSRQGFSVNTEVESSSFSVWNCVITFLQILLVSTVLYGAGWNQGQVYNVTPENLIRYHNFRTVAFLFCVWALQSVALALLLVWAIGKRSYHLCHTWILCETLMQTFIILSLGYFTCRSYLEGEYHTSSSATVSYHRGSNPAESEVLQNSNNNGSTSDALTYTRETSFRPQKHFVFLVILHFLIKGFGFWIVGRYMQLLKTTGVQSRRDSEVGNCEHPNNEASRATPPPSYAHFSKDELPTYDDALKLSSKENESGLGEISGNVTGGTRVKDNSSLLSA